MAPNQDDKKAMKGDINPKVVGALVPKLKIGDRIRLDFVYLGARRWLSKVTPLGKSVDNDYDGPGDEKEFSFRVSSLRSLRIRNVPSKGLRVTKGKLSWTFVIPNVPNLGGKPGAPKSVPDPEILKKVSRFSAGDEVVIDYETSNFAFVIKDIRPAVFTEVGRVVQVDERKVVSRRLGIESTMCPQVVALGKKGTRALLVRPTSTEDSDVPAESGNLAETVKGLEKDQMIEFKYYRQGGYRWLIDAQITNQTASRR